MLRVTIPENELYNELTNEFIYTKTTTLSLEHSLVSISKWEAIYNKPFISALPDDKKTSKEILKYIECMTITQNVDPNVYLSIPADILKKINDYITAPMSATTFSDNKSGRPGREIITSELIYYWMIAYQIPFDCEKWHINRLLNLIRICSIKNAPKKKMSKSDLMSRNTAINAARRARMGSTG